MRREDSPRGEIISFDSFDRARYRQLGQWVALEDVPALFGNIDKVLRSLNDEVSGMSYGNRRKGDLLVKSNMLSQLLEEMLDVAGEEIIEAQIANLS